MFVGIKYVHEEKVHLRKYRLRIGCLPSSLASCQLVPHSWLIMVLPLECALHEPQTSDQWGVWQCGSSRDWSYLHAMDAGPRFCALSVRQAELGQLLSCISSSYNGIFRALFSDLCFAQGASTIAGFSLYTRRNRVSPS